jgi:hypothetical protein
MPQVYTTYIFRSIYDKKRKYSKALMLHREIMGLDFGDKRQVHHINHNGLDNRRCNLKIVCQGENLYYSNRSRKGYYWQKPAKAFCVQLRVNGKRKLIGYYKSEIEARAAYLKARKEANKEYILKSS